MTLYMRTYPYSVDIRDERKWTSQVLLTKVIDWQTGRQVTRGHFWSRDKDGGHTIGSVIRENPMIHANLMALSFLEPELWATEVYLMEMGIFNFFAPVTLTLTRWPSHTNMTRTPGKYIGCANNELRTSRLSKVIVCIWHTDRQTDKWCVVTSCHVTKMASHNSVCRSQKPHATRKSDGSICHRTGVTDDRSYIAGKGILDVFGSCNLDLDPMTFIDELDPYCVEIYRMCKYEFRTSRLSKVIVWQTYVHTYRIDRNYKPRRFEGGQ